MSLDKPKYESWKKSAWLALDRDFLDQVLNLPENLRVEAVQADQDPHRLRVLLSGPDLPESPMNAESPLLHPLVSYEGPSARMVIDWAATLGHEELGSDGP